jgi:hypothetical protein
MQRAVAADYQRLIDDAEAAHSLQDGRRRRTLARLRRELHRIRQRDHFPTPERELALRAVEGLVGVGDGAREVADPK